MFASLSSSFEARDADRSVNTRPRVIWFYALFILMSHTFGGTVAVVVVPYGLYIMRHYVNLRPPCN